MKTSLFILLTTCAIFAAGQPIPPRSPPPAAAPNHQFATPLKFTFGSPASVRHDGFTKVTDGDSFSPAKGHGFDSVQGLLSYDRGVSAIKRLAHEYTANTYGAFRTTSDLTCALIEGLDIHIHWRSPELQT